MELVYLGRFTATIVCHQVVNAWYAEIYFCLEEKVYLEDLLTWLGC